jgi:rubrerythrin
MRKSSLIKALRVVKENERLASESYAAAAEKINHPAGKDLLQQLSEFENFHFERISALEKSLEEDGEYIDYYGRELPLPATFEIKAAQEPNHKSLMKIITEARALEKETELAYADLAIQIKDPQGHEMFNKLSEEERIHFRILSDAYWNLSNLGVWKWSRP